MTASPPPDPDVEALSRAIREFNSWRFYDCHETLEDVWREAGGKGHEGALPDFYQGIIKLAAGFHHLLRGNHKGVVNLLTDGVRLLTPFSPRHHGVEVDRLLDETRVCLELAEALGAAGLERFDRSLIPQIEFDPEAILAHLEKR